MGWLFLVFITSELEPPPPCCYGNRLQMLSSEGTRQRQRMGSGDRDGEVNSGLLDLWRAAHPRADRQLESAETKFQRGKVREAELAGP